MGPSQPDLPFETSCSFSRCPFRRPPPLGVANLPGGMGAILANGARQLSISRFHERAGGCQVNLPIEFPSEPPVATHYLAEQRAAGKGARQRGGADPCPASTVRLLALLTGGGTETQFPLVGSE